MSALWAFGHTSAKVVDHRDLVKRGNFLNGFTVEDANIVQLTEVCGHYFLTPGPVQLEIGFLGNYEDFVVSLDVQVNLGSVALTVDARDREGIDAGCLCCGDHGQVHHSICRTWCYI